MIYDIFSSCEIAVYHVQLVRSHYDLGGGLVTYRRRFRMHSALRDGVERENGRNGKTKPAKSPLCFHKDNTSMQRSAQVKPFDEQRFGSKTHHSDTPNYEILLFQSPKFT